MKIYKIIDNTNGNVYIGKTEQKYLCERLSSHKYDYKRGKRLSSGKIIKNGDYKIELIEETHDDSRERYWIINTECVNKIIPGRTIKESRANWRNNNKDKIKQLYQYQKSPLPTRTSSSFSLTTKKNDEISREEGSLRAFRQQITDLACGSISIFF